MKKQVVTQEEYQKVEAQALAARELLEDGRFQFVRDFFNDNKNYIEQAILNNTVREVQEIVPISDKITRIFKQPKKVQVDEMAGQYKLINKFFDQLNYYAQLKNELDTEMAEKRVALE